MTKIPILRLFPLIALVSLVISCYPDGPESSSDYSLITSAFDETYEFENAVTFLLPDTIIMLKDEGQQEEIKLIEEQKVAFVNQTRDNFTAFGWEDRSITDTTADVLVFITVVSSKYSGNIWHELFYFYGWGDYSPGNPDMRYPWMPNYSSFFYDYNVGSLLITMVDVDGLETDPETPPLVWMGGVNGLLKSDFTVQTEPVIAAIDKIFELSPILDKN